MTGGDSGEHPIEPVQNGDDPSIPIDEIVYRRIPDDPNMVTIDTVTGERGLTSGAFRPDPDGLSVFRRAKLYEAGLGPDAVLSTKASLVVSLTVEDVRSVKPLGLRDDPWPKDVPDPDHPRYCAHALIIGWSAAGGKNKRHACQRDLADAAAQQFVDLSSWNSPICNCTFHARFLGTYHSYRRGRL